MCIVENGMIVNIANCCVKIEQLLCKREILIIGAKYIWNCFVKLEQLLCKTEILIVNIVGITV